MKINFKKLTPTAVMPSKAHSTDAGMDLTATSKIYDKDGNVSYGTGIAIEIPKGYMGLIFPRSSNSKKDLLLCNSVGIIDSGYRGEIFVKFKPSVICSAEDLLEDVDDDYFDNIICPDTNDFRDYNVGDRIAQLIIMPYPEVEFNEVDELNDSNRGVGGFGSTGR